AATAAAAATTSLSTSPPAAVCDSSSSSLVVPAVAVSSNLSSSNNNNNIPSSSSNTRTDNNSNISSSSSNNNNMSDASNSSDAAKTPTAAAAATATPAAAAPPPTAAAAATVVAVPSKSAVSQRNVDIKIEKSGQMEVATQQLSKKVLKLDLGGKNLDEYSLKSPKSPIAARLPHQTSLTSSVDVEDRKTLREALYQGIFHRHRRTIFAVGSFLRMLRSRNSQYNTIRSSSEGEDIDEVR
ncbi:hypothetical protein KR222_003518, partial [Zaprionus bogoriensis]